MAFTMLAEEGTTNSQRADSAIDLDMTASAAPLQDTQQLEPEAPRPPLRPLADRLSEFAAVASAAEQCNALSDRVYSALHAQLDGIESHLDRQNSTPLKLVDSVPSPALSATLTDDEPGEGAFEQSSSEVLTHLTSTVSSLRLRHQEQRHLHGLLMTKLDAAAQRCLDQEQSMQELNDEIRHLRQSNDTFSRHNNDLRIAMSALKAEAAEKEVAMEAMTGAVSGLEGWIENSSTQNSPEAHTDVERRRQRREVMRGHGRFRGRYSLDGSAEARARYGGLDGVSELESRDLREGVKAWLRGFRDVEEGLRARENRNRAELLGQIQSGDEGEEVVGVEEDDWSHFETASAA